MNSVFQEACQFLDDYIPKWFERGTPQTLFIYVSGPQGSGKSYNSSKIYKYLKDNYEPQGKNIAMASIDDFYLTHMDQEALSFQFKDNKLLQGRGLPGTHDMSLLNECLSTMVERKSNNEKSDEKYLYLPQYDKSLFNGEGDRTEEFRKISLPIDIFILEGWFLGFEPLLQKVEEDVIQGDMADVNAKLFMYSDLMWNNPEVKSLGIVFSTDNIENVYTWRTEQEHETIRSKGSGMSDEEVRLFVDRYMPCYRMYFDNFIHGESLGSIATLTIGVSKKREVYSTKIRCIE